MEENGRVITLPLVRRPGRVFRVAVLLLVVAVAFVTIGRFMDAKKGGAVVILCGVALGGIAGYVGFVAVQIARWSDFSLTLGRTSLRIPVYPLWRRSFEDLALDGLEGIGTGVFRSMPSVALQSGGRTFWLPLDWLPEGVSAEDLLERLRLRASLATLEDPPDAPVLAGIEAIALARRGMAAAVVGGTRKAPRVLGLARTVSDYLDLSARLAADKPKRQRLVLPEELSGIWRGALDHDGRAGEKLATFPGQVLRAAPLPERARLLSVGAKVEERARFTHSVPRPVPPFGMFDLVAAPPSKEPHDPCQPTPFGYKCAWLAFQGADPDAVRRALELEAAVPAGFGEGVVAAYAGRVFIAPVLEGWTLAVSAGFEDLSDDRPIVVLVKRLSRELGCEVQYFASERVTEYHAWLRVVDGAVSRAYGWLGSDGRTLIDEGEPDLAERGLPFSAGDGAPGEKDVMELAAAWSLDPTALGQRPPASSLGVVGDRLDSPARP